MNKLDKDYQALLQDILENGVTKETRNGGTISVFGKQIRHRMSDGFPLLTTKKMAWRQIIVELLWFLRGDTNIKFLVNNNCHIWDGDAYKNYCKEYWNLSFLQDKIEYGSSFYNHDTDDYTFEELTQEDFINNIKTDDDFAKEWGSLGSIYGKQWRSWGKKNVVNYDLENVKSSDKVKVMDLIRNDGDYSKYDVKVTYQNNTIDQITNLINDLKTNPDSRRMMVIAYNVGELDSMVLPPCHYGFQVYTRELSEDERNEIRDMQYFKNNLHQALKGSDTKIDWENIPTRAISLMYNARSQDVPLGTPFNIASYGLLLTILGKMVNMVPDELIANMGDCHIYLNQVDGVKEQLTREPYELPHLNINTEWWPTESGECGIGNIDAQAVLNGFSDLNFCKSLLEEDIQLYKYQSHPTIKFPLSN